MAEAEITPIHHREVRSVCCLRLKWCGQAREGSGPPKSTGVCVSIHALFAGSAFRGEQLNHPLMSELAVENDFSVLTCHPGLQVLSLLDIAEKLVALSSEGPYQVQDQLS